MATLLKPLLTLSEDPLTRRYGSPKVRRLYSAVISGDLYAVLKLFGRDMDSLPLSLDDARQLRTIVSNVHSGTEAHGDIEIQIDNAFLTIAEIHDRTPGEHAKPLMSDIVRRLINSPQLNWTLGIDKIASVIAKATPTDRREVAGRMVEDLLGTVEPIVCESLNGQTLSLHEAVELVRKAVPLILMVREQDRLELQHDQLLLKWMETRTITVLNDNKEKESASFGLSELDTWLDSCEGLLASLGSRYTALIGTALEEENIEGLDTDVVIGRCRAVFENLLTTGQEDVLWNQVDVYASVRQDEAVSLAVETLLRNIERPNASILTKLVGTLAERLSKDMSDSEWTLYSWEDIGVRLIEIVSKRNRDMGEKAHSKLVELCRSWSKDDATSDLSIRLLELLNSIDQALSEEVIDDWTTRILGDLPVECIDWVGRHFGNRLSSEQRKQVCLNIHKLTATNNISEDEGMRHARLIRSMNSEALRTSEMQSHLDQLLPFLARQYSNQNAYLHRVFGVLPSLLQHCRPSVVGRSLQQLFMGARNNISLVGWLHAHMVGKWLKPSAEYDSYNPETLFDHACTVLKQHPNGEHAHDILKSAKSMLDSHIISKEKTQNLIDAAWELWPHNQQASLDALLGCDYAPATQDIANLLDSVNPENMEGYNNLHAAWKHMARSRRKGKLAVMRHMLAKPPAVTQIAKMPFYSMGKR